MSVTYTSTNTDKAKFDAVIKRLTRLKPDLEIQLSKDVKKASADLTKTMKGNAHVITGNMRDSVSTTALTKNSAIVGPSVEYAVYENGRGGDHAFFDKSVDQFRPKFVTIVRAGVHTVLKKKGS